MFPPPFDYHAPATLEEAVALLARHPDEAKVLSGGQSLLPLMKLRLGQPAHLVDIGRIPGLEYVEERNGLLESIFSGYKFIPEWELGESECAPRPGQGQGR